MAVKLHSCSVQAAAMPQWRAYGHTAVRLYGHTVMARCMRYESAEALVQAWEVKAGMAGRGGPRPAPPAGGTRLGSLPPFCRRAFNRAPGGVPPRAARPRHGAG